MKTLLISIFVFSFLASGACAQEEDEKKALQAIQTFYKHATRHDYQKALPYSGLAWPTDPEQLKVLREFGIEPDRPQDEKRSECESNLKNYSTALEMYGSDYEGQYPSDPGLLTPNYLLSLPTCPASNQVAYNYSWTANPYTYRILCVGPNHGADPVENPAFDSVIGLDEVAESWLFYITDVKTDGDEGTFRFIRGIPQGTLFRALVDETYKINKNEGEWQLDPAPFLEPLKKELSKAPTHWSSLLEGSRELGIIMAVIYSPEDEDFDRLVKSNLCLHRQAILAREIVEYCELKGTAPKKEELNLGVCPVSLKPHGYVPVGVGSRVWCQDSPHGMEVEIITGDPAFEDF